MVPSTAEAVVILLLAIAPGYVAIVTWARAKTWKGFGSDLDTVLRSLVASLIVQIPMFPLALVFGLLPDVSHWQKHALALFVWLLFTVLVVPALGGQVASWYYDSFLFPLAQRPVPLGTVKRWFPQWEPTFPSAWDRFFVQSIVNGSWIILDMGDGKFVAGTWESGSYARTTPAIHGVFLKRQWQVDNDGQLMADAVPNSGGLLIDDASTIKRMRVIVPPPDTMHDQTGSNPLHILEERARWLTRLRMQRLTTPTTSRHAVRSRLPR